MEVESRGGGDRDLGLLVILVGAISPPPHWSSSSPRIISRDLARASPMHSTHYAHASPCLCDCVALSRSYHAPASLPVNPPLPPKAWLGLLPQPDRNVASSNSSPAECRIRASIAGARSLRLGHLGESRGKFAGGRAPFPARRTNRAIVLGAAVVVTSTWRLMPPRAPAVRPARSACGGTR